MPTYTDKQLGYARAVVSEGRRLGITERGLIIGLATVLVECDLIMYANRADPETLKYPHERIGSDSKSSGLFQQQPPWWGTAAERMDPTASARMFFEALRKLDYNNTSRSPGRYAQDVQRSSFPTRYDERMGQATELYRLLGAPTAPKPTEGVHTMGDPVWLADVLRAEGLTCDIFDGAFDRGHGDFGAIWGVLAHHTGASGNPGPGAIARHPSLGLASQLHLDRNGKYTLCGVGIAWHAGQGSWPGIAKNNANAVTIGIEAENNGTEGWSPAQYDAYVRGVAAILRKLGHGSDRVIGHKEWAAVQGKWDPGGIDMNAFRRDVQARLTPPPEPAPIVNEINEAAKRNPWVGDRVRPEEITVGPDSKGRLGVFTNAHIYFHPDTGAFPIPHKDPAVDESGLFEAYAGYEYERGPLGYPVREFAPLNGATGRGAVQAFQGGVLYRKDGQPGYIVHGAIAKRWADEGYELGPSGWPVSNESTDQNGNRFQVFENAILYWHSTGVVSINKHVA